MKKQIITFTLMALVTCLPGSDLLARRPEHDGEKRHGRHGRGEHLEHLTQELNLSADQQAKIRPLIDQTKPQLRAIREEAMQKSKAVMENTMGQIRPLLTAEQQQKLDRIRKAKEELHAARKALREAHTQ